MKLPKRGIIPFDFSEVKIGDRILRTITMKENTKREYEYIYDTDIIRDLDSDRQLCLVRFDLVRDFKNTSSYCYYIDRRTFRQRLWDRITLR